MRADGLDHRELLELDPEGGVIRFAGQRALLLDAVAMGLLRKYLVENFGLTAARTVLTQFGFAHGWRMAEAMQAEFKWETQDDWASAGTRINALEGLFRVEPGSGGALSKGGLLLGGSYESEQHLLHFGRSDLAVCWTISGLTSGYLSRSAAKDSRTAAWARETLPATSTGARAKSGATSAPRSCASMPRSASRSASTSPCSG